MKLKELFERYSGRLHVSEATADMVIESDGIKHELAGVTLRMQGILVMPRRRG